jgi:hypothetical protein
VYLVQVSLLLIGQQGLGHFFRYYPLLPIDWKIVQILRHAGGKRPIQRQPLLVQYKQQANSLLSRHNYTPLLISGNDKNKQLTLLSQRKLALTVRNRYTSCDPKSLTHLQNLKNGPVLYSGLKLTIDVIKSKIYLLRHSLEKVYYQLIPLNKCS